MCGRFTLHASPEEVAALFGLDSAPELAPRYNVAPTQPVGIVRFDPHAQQREWSLALWGLIPSWSKDPSIGARMINARSETVVEKPSYRAAFKRRRCLLPANGFFEWKRDGRAKQPFYFSSADSGLLALAGLWESWTGPDGSQLDSCTILTTDANELVAGVHDRMPVILSPQDFDEWLGDGRDADAALQTALRHLMRPYPAEQMTARPVSNYVNSPRNEGPDCIAAAG
jgi:putative SOS response-associated peptidase YedK